MRCLCRVNLTFKKCPWLFGMELAFYALRDKGIEKIKKKKPLNCWGHVLMQHWNNVIYSAMWPEQRESTLVWFKNASRWKPSDEISNETYDEYNDWKGLRLSARKGTVVSWKEKDTQWNRVNYLLTQVVQYDKYYKSRAVGVTSEVGLTTDRRPFRAVG